MHRGSEHGQKGVEELDGQALGEGRGREKAEGDRGGEDKPGATKHPEEQNKRDRKITDVIGETHSICMDGKDEG